MAVVLRLIEVFPLLPAMFGYGEKEAPGGKFCGDTAQLPPVNEAPPLLWVRESRPARCALSGEIVPPPLMTDKQASTMLWAGSPQVTADPIVHPPTETVAGSVVL